MIYEVMYIVPTKYSDTEIEGVNQEVAKLFAKHGATVEKTENLGKLKLAYPIKKESYGTYMLVFISAEGEAMQKIDQELKLDEHVLRHLMVKREKGIPTSAFKLEVYTAPLTPEGKRASAKPKVQDRPKKAPASKEKMSTAELDKKLDEILDSDIVSGV